MREEGNYVAWCQSASLLIFLPVCLSVLPGIRGDADQTVDRVLQIDLCKTDRQDRQTGKIDRLKYTI